MGENTGNIVHYPQFVIDQVHIPILKVLQEDGTLYQGAMDPEIDREEALKIYDCMLFLRIFDERMLASQRQGRISFYMATKGEEATHVAAASAISDDDLIFAQYREAGPLYYRGFTVDDFMNQLFGSELDLGKGRQMPIHYGSKELHYATISSPLTTQLPQAAGAAYGQKLEGKGQCTLCFFGDGASSEGDFHAAFNFAAVLEAPVIFFCKNNRYAISTPSSEQFRTDGIVSRGLGYGIKSIRVDGNDVFAVHMAMVEARRYAVENNRPVFIEAMTYRLSAHSTSDDPTGYRSKDEEEEWHAQDPVRRLKKWLIAKDWWSEEQEKKEIESKQTTIRDAMKRAEVVPAPPIEDMFTDVYDEIPTHLQEQMDELREHIKKYPESYPKSAGRLK